MEKALVWVLLCLPVVVPIGYSMPSRPWVSPQNLKKQPKTPYSRPQYNQNNQPPQSPQTYSPQYSPQYRPRYPPQYSSVPQYNRPTQVPQYPFGLQQTALPPQSVQYGSQYQYRPPPSWTYPPKNPPQYPPMPLNQLPGGPQFNLLNPATLNFLEGLDLPPALEFSITSQLSSAFQQQNPAGIASLLGTLQSLAQQQDPGSSPFQQAPRMRPVPSPPGKYNVPVIGQALTG